MNYPDPAASRRKALVGNVFKVLLAGGLLFWLVKSGGIRPEYLLVEAVQIPTLIMVCFVIAAGMFLSVPRYVELLKGAGLSVSMWDSFRISAVMYFFTQCVLGSASGDVARFFYTTRITGQGTKVGAAIIVDRIVGIMGLFLLGGLGLALNWSLVEQSPELRHLAPPVLAAFCLLWLGVFLGFLALAKGRRFGLLAGLIFPALSAIVWFSGNGYLSAEVGPVLFYASVFSLCGPLIAPEFMETGFIYRKFFKGSKLGEKLGEVVSAILIYRNSASSLLKIATLTMVQHLSFIYVLYLFSQIQNLPQLPDFNEIFVSAPLAFLAGIIPAPAAGLGVNEAAFETLLRLASSGVVTAGASLFLMFRIWTTLFSLSGVFFLTRSKK
ncbi:UPF0104 family protein [Marinifilum sp. JC120]|nr:UPF0104 family protein [Marinifilum sp. JC120]